MQYGHWRKTHNQGSGDIPYQKGYHPGNSPALQMQWQDGCIRGAAQAQLPRAAKLQPRTRPAVERVCQDLNSWLQTNPCVAEDSEVRFFRAKAVIWLGRLVLALMAALVLVLVLVLMAVLVLVLMAVLVLVLVLVVVLMAVLVLVPEFRGVETQRPDALDDWFEKPLLELITK